MTLSSTGTWWMVRRVCVWGGGIACHFVALKLHRRLSQCCRFESASDPVMVCLLSTCADTTKSKKGKLYPAGSMEVESTASADHEGTADGTKPEELNKKVLQIIQRVRDKLTGRMREGAREGVKRGN